MNKIKINLKRIVDDSYEILIENNCLEKIPEYLSKFKEISRFCIVTDHNVEKLFAHKLLKAMKEKKLNTVILSIPPGEKSKSRITKANLENKLLELGYGRDSLLIALGGGVVGDLAGFLAATYMRGVPFIQIPTTLLAMADASVGGKNSVSLPACKNIIGTFYQPKAVFIDPKTLGTLHEEELVAGLSEIIKTGLTLDSKLFNLIEQNIEKIFKLDYKIINEIIELSIKNKAKVVITDEKENGLRKVLNYGHTIGHALEAILNYEIPHGHAVAIGMYYASKISLHLKILKKEDFIRQNQLLKKLNLNLEIPPSLNIDELIKLLYLDKKVNKREIHFTLIEKIGKIHKIKNEYTIPVKESIIKKILTDKNK